MSELHFSRHHPYFGHGFHKLFTVQRPDDVFTLCTIVISKMFDQNIFSLLALKDIITTFIVHSAPSSCASQPIGLHRNLNFWPTESHILSICVSCRL